MYIGATMGQLIDYTPDILRRQRSLYVNHLLPFRNKLFEGGLLASYDVPF